MSTVSWPLENSSALVSPSRQAWISKKSESALTALMPTPLRPTDFLNASLSYFAPVLIWAAQSNSLPERNPAAEVAHFHAAFLVDVDLALPCRSP